MRIALGFWGLTRSLEDHTIESIRKNIFSALSACGIEYDVFIHTYKKGDHDVSAECKLLAPVCCEIHRQRNMNSMTNLTRRMTMAFDMARDVHNDQTLKGTDLPYLLHLLDVCSIALRHGADEDQAIAALLHDAVEDGEGMVTAGEIGVVFGQRVKQVVLECSDSTVADPDNKLDWWHRKITYLDHLKEASADAAMVTGADKLSNARSIVADVGVHGDKFWERFNTCRVGSLWYYRNIDEILPDRLPRAEGAERLGSAYVAAVDEMVEFVGRDQAKLALEEAEALEDEHRKSGGK